ncbi:MAG: SCO family protein, partial [Gammaproteobacteria bacterium]
MATLAHGDQHDPKTQPVILAPGYAELTFSAPPAGSYELPVLGIAGDGDVLGSDGAAVRLASLLGEKPVLMSFVYTSCDDVNGCPLATYVLSQVAKRINDDPELHGQVRFVSLSFDPMNDTPQVMADYGDNFRPEGADWRFLTCGNNENLAPILEHYNQTVAMEYDADGNPSGRY